jgi:hypothetical protein
MLVNRDLPSPGRNLRPEQPANKKNRFPIVVAAIILTVIVLSAACRLVTPLSTPAQTAQPLATSPAQTAQANLTTAPCGKAACPTSTVTASPLNASLPVFSHVILILLENHEYDKVVGNTNLLPNFNRWIAQYSLLAQYYAVAHPSLPNYLALIGGDTFGIHRDCGNCFIAARSLPDEIEATGRTWKVYQQGLPSPCFLGTVKGVYSQATDPFIHFESIRNDTNRCKQHILPLAQLDQDLSQGYLPDFVFITPNLCNSAHSCYLNIADGWLAVMLGKLTSSPLYDSHILIVITFDEGSTNDSCCGLGSRAGGHVATLLISPLVKAGFKDDTPYDHYSLLKTIETSWGLELLGHAADPQTNLIAEPFGETAIINLLHSR